MSKFFFLGSRFSSNSYVKLEEVPQVLRPLLDGVHLVLGLNLDIGYSEGTGQKSLSCIIVPQAKDFRVYVIDGVQVGTQLSEVTVMAKGQYSHLFEDGSSRYLVEIGPDSSSKHQFFVLKDLGRSHPSEETEMPHSKIIEKDGISNSTENFLSPVVYATNDNPNLSPSRKNVPTVEGDKIKIREASQPFSKEQENDPVEDNLLDDMPISIHGASSAKRIHSNNLSSVIDDEACTEELRHSKHVDLKWRAPRTWGRLRSVSESDAIHYGEEEDQSQSDNECCDSLDVTRSLPPKLSIVKCVEPEARKWERDKSEIVTFEVKKPIVASEEMVAVGIHAGEDIIPTGKDTTPSDEDTTPTGKDATPTGKDATPTGKDATPTDKDTAPTGKDILPTGKYVTPTDKDTTPTDKDTTLTGKNTTSTEFHCPDPSSCHITAAAIPPDQYIDAEESSLSRSEEALCDAVVANPSGQVSLESSLSHGLQPVKEETQISAESHDCMILSELDDHDNVCKKKYKETRTMVISLNYQCSGDSSSDKSFCCQSHDRQWSQNVLNKFERLMRTEISIGKSEIHVERNVTELNVESQQSYDSSEESIDSMIFLPPIDCGSQNHQQDIPVMTKAASCPTQPVQWRPMASGKASSMPVKAPEAAACVGQMAEIDENQESYYQVLAQQGLANNQARDRADCRDDTKDLSGLEGRNVDFVPASEVEPSNQVLVYPERPQGVPRRTSGLKYGNGILKIAGNFMFDGRCEEFDEKNQTVVVNKAEDNTDHMFKGAAVNNESSTIKRKHSWTFLDYGHYANIKPGGIIYSTDSIPLSEGISCPSLRSPEHYKVLGRGGNGTVYEFMIQGVKYAVKETDYRCAELNAWRKLNHPHLIPLLAVGMGPLYDMPPGRVCYQFMPLMSGSVRDCMGSCETLYELSKRDRLSLNLISNNFLYILKSCLEALDYLAMRNMQHHDIKGSNVLVRKTCNCSSIWSCDCAWKEEKFLVMLADLDSVKETKEAINPKALPRVMCRMKTDDELKSDPGTMGIHAPEQLLVPTELKDSYNKTIVGGSQEKVENNLCGWWCDIWSVGRMMVTFYEGRNDGAKDRIDHANILLHQPNAPCAYSSKNEALIAFAAVKDFLCSANSHGSFYLSLTAELANRCMNPDFKARPSASDLLAWLGNKGLT